MTEQSIAENGKAAARQARGAADWLGLAAAPTFALMTWTSATDEPQNMMCPAVSGPLPFGGMAWMYLLMCLFHMSPWLKLVPCHPRQLTQRATQAEGN